ncbi:MAG: hypothetical protein QM811_16535 [Pirellulales bacterium]
MSYTNDVGMHHTSTGRLYIRVIIERDPGTGIFSVTVLAGIGQASEFGSGCDLGGCDDLDCVAISSCTYTRNLAAMTFAPGDSYNIGNRVTFHSIVTDDTLGPGRSVCDGNLPSTAGLTF